MMSERPVNVRTAEPSDEDAVFRLLVKLHEDNSIGFPFDEEEVRNSIRSGTERKGGIVAVIDAPHHPGEIAASVGLHWGEFWYSKKRYLAETWLFVDPAYRRGTGFANDLMAYAKWVRDTLNGVEPVPVFTSVSSRRRLALKAKWWARRGELIGHIYLIR